MDSRFESTDRQTTDFVLFGLTFLGFLIGATGLILGCAGCAVAGAALMVLCIAAFGLRP